MEQEKENIFILKEKSFNLISNKNNEYKIILSIYSNEVFNIDIYSKNIIPSKKYSLSCKINDLIKNRFFKIFLNVEEIFIELENKIQKSIIIEDTNVIYLDIPIGLTIIKDIILEIKEIEKSKDDIIQELKIELNNQIDNNKTLELNIKKQNEIIINLNNEIKELKNIKKKDSLKNSLIVKSDEIDIIKNWISPKKNIYFKLLYQATKDGDKISQMQEKINNKGENIIFCYIENGCRYGGYTSLSWDTYSNIKNDTKAFLFSLDKKEKYNNNNNGLKAITCLDSWWFCFTEAISLPLNKNYGYDGFLKNNLDWANPNKINYKNINKGTDLTNGLERFRYKEVEVYQIIYDENN